MKKITKLKSIFINSFIYMDKAKNRKTKIMITGAKGFLGKNVFRSLDKEDEFDVLGFSKKDFDITKFS